MILARGVCRRSTIWRSGKRPLLNIDKISTEFVQWALGERAFFSVGSKLIGAYRLAESSCVRARERLRKQRLRDGKFVMLASNNFIMRTG